jgi:threonyl-tRNA synthetase
MNNKIRAATMLKIPWLLVVGDRDAANQTVSVRLRSGDDLGALPIADFADYAMKNVKTKALELK